MKSIAVLLTVHNRKDKTLNCLKLLLEQQPIKDHHIEVYLTDDKCTDGTPEAVKEIFPNVNIVKGSGELFWNRGMHLAWQEAAKKNYDFYLWLNDDTYLYNYALKSIIETSNRLGNESIIVGPTCATNRTDITYGGRIDGKKLIKPSGKPIKVITFNGNVVLVPRKVYYKLGNLDYKYRHSRGDTDYGYRATKAGIPIYQNGTYVGVCERHKDHAKWCNPKVPLKERWQTLFKPTGYNPYEQFYYERKHFGIIKASFHFILIFARCLFPKFWIKINHAKI